MSEDYLERQEKAARQLAAVLDELSAEVKAGTCRISLETMLFAVDLLTNRELTQDDAQRMLNMTRYSFEKAVEEGALPAGRRRSVKASRKVWFSYDLRQILRARMKKKKAGR